MERDGIGMERDRMGRGGMVRSGKRMDVFE